MTNDEKIQAVMDSYHSMPYWFHLLFFIGALILIWHIPAGKRFLKKADRVYSSCWNHYLKLTILWVLIFYWTIVEVSVNFKPTPNVENMPVLDARLVNFSLSTPSGGRGDRLLIEHQNKKYPLSVRLSKKSKESLQALSPGTPITVSLYLSVMYPDRWLSAGKIIVNGEVLKELPSYEEYQRKMESGKRRIPFYLAILILMPLLMQRKINQQRNVSR